MCIHMFIAFHSNGVPAGLWFGLCIGCAQQRLWRAFGGARGLVTRWPLSGGRCKGKYGKTLGKLRVKLKNGSTINIHKPNSIPFVPEMGGMMWNVKPQNDGLLTLAILFQQHELGAMIEMSRMIHRAGQVNLDNVDPGITTINVE